MAVVVGQDAIRMGVSTGLAGFALVALFMLVLYRGWGLIANLALSLNVALTLAALSLLGATQLDAASAGRTISAVLKYPEDVELVEAAGLADVVTSNA